MPQTTKTPNGGTITRYDPGERMEGPHDYRAAAEEILDLNGGGLPRSISFALRGRSGGYYIFQKTTFVLDEKAFDEIARVERELEALNARRDEMFAAARSLIASGQFEYNPTAAQVQQGPAPTDDLEPVDDQGKSRFGLLEIDEEVPKPKRKRTRKVATP